MLPAYKIILTLIYPFLGLFLKKRLKNNKESAVRYYEKLGKKLPEFTKESSQKVIWFCAASIGESLSVLPIITELCLNSHKVINYIT
jgi:3-deoxy-D-manno-octulosonic-acid transferase